MYTCVCVCVCVCIYIYIYIYIYIHIQYLHSILLQLLQALLRTLMTLFNNIKLWILLFFKMMYVLCNTFTLMIC